MIVSMVIDTNTSGKYAHSHLYEGILVGFGTNSCVNFHVVERLLHAAEGSRRIFFQMGR